MTDNNNPYAPPRAGLHDPEQGRRRPGWVWAIFIFYIFSTVAMVISYYLLFSGMLPLQEAQKQQLASLTALDHAASVVILALNLAAAIQLFRLRRISMYLFPSALVVGLLFTAWRVASKGWAATMGASGTNVYIGWAMTMVICVYAWRLARRGVLK